MEAQEHNYRIKLNRLIAEGKLPNSGVWRVDIEHDSWCRSNCGERCNCDPDIYLYRDGNRAARKKL